MRLVPEVLLKYNHHKNEWTFGFSVSRDDISVGLTTHSLRLEWDDQSLFFVGFGIGATRGYHDGDPWIPYVFFSARHWYDFPWLAFGGK